MTDEDKLPTVAQAREWVKAFYNEKPTGWLERSAMVLSDAVAAHDAREPLVQKVIRLFRDRTEAQAKGSPFADGIDHGLTLATRKLAEWKP